MSKCGWPGQSRIQALIAIEIFLRTGSNFPLLAEEMGMLDGRKRKVEEDMDPGSATCEVVWTVRD
ncbi:hypothetical protein E4U57_006548 [Claviceps arundinis]|uniref:Uncharacterized protein n=1 Tax=Claviceps arundinis TaxID=1623583 RepID=A0ABQ7PH78_9HYPO|nr:hypothetical protein E4U57_006548 [Claviceps arundinis]